MNPIFTKMVDAVEAANAAPDDYINPADGLKYCGKCHTPKEAFYPAELQQGLYQDRLCASALPNAENGKKRSAGNTSECPI
jgi:DNA replication protein DnaC